MASLNEAFNNTIEERKNVIKPNTYNIEDNLNGEIFADNDMGHFELKNADNKLITLQQLYDLVYADLKVEDKKGIRIYYRTIPEETKIYSLNGKNITVNFRYISYRE